MVPAHDGFDFSKIIPTEEAIELYKQDFIEGKLVKDYSPLLRELRPIEKSKEPNVMLIIMESMSSDYITNYPQLTPYLNSLIDKSYYFNNIYSQGSHTNQGFFAALFGFSSYFDRNITDTRNCFLTKLHNNHIPFCEGLPFNLSEQGYELSFYIPHNPSFDNMEIFLLKNSYQTSNIFSLNDYERPEVQNGWGVTDYSLFNYAIGKFETMSVPFFTTIMTISNHPPYVVPKEFEHISGEKSEQTVYYSDCQIKRFMDRASKEEWFDNTIFVFIGDHGKTIGKVSFEMPLSLNHVPLIIYSPLFDDVPRVINNFGGQIDVFPTVMGMLNIEYDNNSMGIDLLKENRSYAVFTTDEKLGCINENFLYCKNIVSKQEFLYDLR